MMKFKRIALLLLAFSLAGAGTIFADSVLEKYYAKKISVKLNGNEIDNTGLVVDFGKDSRAMAPLRDIVQSMGGIVRGDNANDSIDIIKPNVQLSMHTFQYVKEDIQLSRPYGSFEKGENSNLAVLAQIDSLTSPISSLRMTIVDPFGAEVEKIEKSITEHQGNFWFRFLMSKVNFKYSGDYKVNLFMKLSGDNEYAQVSQMTIKSISSK